MIREGDISFLPIYSFSSSFLKITIFVNVQENLHILVLSDMRDHRFLHIYLRLKTLRMMKNIFGMMIIEICYIFTIGFMISQNGEIDK